MPAETGDASAAGLELSLELMAEIEPALAARRARLGRGCISELSFSNFHLFRAAHRYRYFRGNWPHIVGRTYDGATHVTPLFDTGRVPDDVLHGLLNGRDCFYPLAAAELDDFDGKHFEWRSEREDADYLYPLQNFLDYAGAPLRKKRQATSQLQAGHVLRDEVLSSATHADARRVLEGWMRDKGKPSGSADESACIEAIDHAATFALQGRVFYADAAPAGFLLAQPLAERTLAIRFAKGLAAYPGIYPYMFQACCRQWQGAIDWLNFEQDLGNPNFRRTKQSFAPEALLEKFRVRLRQ
jgi:hypothetical protein